MKLYEELDNKARKEAEMKYNMQLVEDLLSVMEDYKRKINGNLMGEITDIIDSAITDIESLKSDMEYEE